MFNFQIKKSDIAGKGVFAVDPIKKGTVLYITWLKRPNENSKYFEDSFLQSMINNATNHSDDPNTVTIFNASQDAYYRVAIKDIAPGTEITGNYKQSLDLFKSHGYIVDYNWLWFKNQ